MFDLFVLAVFLWRSFLHLFFLDRMFQGSKRGLYLVYLYNHYAKTVVAVRDLELLTGEDYCFVVSFMC